MSNFLHISSQFLVTHMIRSGLAQWESPSLNFIAPILCLRERNNMLRLIMTRMTPSQTKTWSVKTIGKWGNLCKQLLTSASCWCSTGFRLLWDSRETGHVRMGDSNFSNNGLFSQFSAHKIGARQTKIPTSSLQKVYKKVYKTESLCQRQMGTQELGWSTGLKKIESGNSDC